MPRRAGFEREPMNRLRITTGKARRPRDFQPNDVMTDALATMLEELLRMAEALRPLRQVFSE